MKKSLSALLLGLVMLAGAGNSQAADVAQKNTQSKAVSAPIVVADAQKPKTAVPQAQGRLALTDDQLDGVRAGHYFWGIYHWGLSNWGYWGVHYW
jgi:hypothetical protein